MLCCYHHGVSMYFKINSEGPPQARTLYREQEVALKRHFLSVNFLQKEIADC